MKTKKAEQNTAKKEKHGFFEKLAAKVTRATGSTPAIIIAFSTVII